MTPDIPDDPWAFLKTHTPARLAQGRTGHALPTRALLRFQLDHARARDAVASGLDADAVWAAFADVYPKPLYLRSQAADRATYLRRPDLGRLLHPESEQLLRQYAGPPADASIIVADGLSATAVNQHAGAVVNGLWQLLTAQGWTLAPLCFVEQGRVAVADAIASELQTRSSLILIGERPGLSAPDSLGAYLTYGHRPGLPPWQKLTDGQRNCVSNIRPGGLPPMVAVDKLMYLLTAMHQRQQSGIDLKDESVPKSLTESPRLLE